MAKTIKKPIQSQYEGLQDHIPTLPTPPIETFKNVYPGRDYVIEMTVPEFTAICPKTGLPDFGTLHIEYTPDKQCIELKSFKEYIVSYRSLGIFHEYVVNKVLDDFVKACKPRKAHIHGDFHVRGGITIRVTARYERSRRKRS